MEQYTHPENDPSSEPEFENRKPEEQEVILQVGPLSDGMELDNDGFTDLEQMLKDLEEGN